MKTQTLRTRCESTRGFVTKRLITMGLFALSLVYVGFIALISSKTGKIALLPRPSDLLKVAAPVTMDVDFTVKEVSMASPATQENVLSDTTNGITARFAKSTLDTSMTGRKIRLSFSDNKLNQNEIARFHIGLVSNKPQGQVPIGEDQILFSADARTKGTNYYSLEYDISKLNELYAPSSLTFTWNNPQTGMVEKIPTTYNQQSGKLTAKVNHFSEFGLTGVKAQVYSPTLKSWETNLYTGSVGFTESLDIPPGRGGTTPSVALMYNSNKANGLSPEQKGGWVGPGWDIVSSEIRFDGWTNNSIKKECWDFVGTRDKGPQYSLVLGGTESPLYWVGDDDANAYAKFISKDGNVVAKGFFGTYKGSTQYDPNQTGCYLYQGSNGDGKDDEREKIITRWEVTSAGGTHLFGGDPNSMADRRIKGVMAPTKYMLTRSTDISGNIITYENQIEAVDTHVRAVYPKSISYNSGSRIDFVLESKVHPPTFTDVSTFNEIEYNYETKRLKEVNIYLTPSQLYRSYKMVYDTSSYGPYDTLISYDTYIGSVSPANKLVPPKYTYEMRPSGLKIEYTKFDNHWYCGVYLNDVPTSFQNFDQLRGIVGKYPSVQNDQGAQCEDGGRRLDRASCSRLYNAGFASCSGSFSTPSTGCPALAFAGVYDVQFGQCFNPASDGSFQGQYVVWAASDKAPFMKKIENNYGGVTEFSYTSYVDQSERKLMNRNAIVQKRTYDTSTPSKVVKEDYEYGQYPSGVPLRPNAGGGFSVVTKKSIAADGVTEVRTSNYFFPLSADYDRFIDPETDQNNVMDPEKNPFYGSLLRSVTYSISGSTERIYSDSFTTYSFVPAHNPHMFNGIIDSTKSDTLNQNLFDKGVGTRVVSVTDTFAPKSANFVMVPRVSDAPQTIPLTLRNSEMIHGQSIAWYDRFGSVEKSAQYAEVTGFVDVNYSLKDARIRDGKWWETDASKTFTHGIVFNPYLFKGTTAFAPLPQGTAPTTASLRKFSYNILVRSPAYLTKLLTGLTKESFTSTQNSSQFSSQTTTPFADIAAVDRWQLTQNTYDNSYTGTDMTRYKGRLTSQTVKNTYYPPGWAPGPPTITTSTQYDQYGNVIIQTDPLGTKTTTSYVASGAAYENILPSAVVVSSSNGTVLSHARVQYDAMWRPVASTDVLNNLSSQVTYDCLGRLQKKYKNNPVTGAVETSNPSETYFYYDYQGAGCGEGVVRVSGSGTPPLPHLRTKVRISSTSSDNNYLYADVISNGLGQTLQNQSLATLVDGVRKSVVTETSYHFTGAKEWDSTPTTASPVTAVDALPIPARIPLSNLLLTRYTYDELSRVIATRSPDNKLAKTEYRGLTTIAYDPNDFDSTGNLVSNASVSYSQTDGFGRSIRSYTTNLPTSASPQYGMKVETQYNLADAPTTVTVKKCQTPSCTGADSTLYTTTTSYDRLGRKYETVDPDLGKWNFSYNATGNLVAQKDPKGQIINYQYDPLGRVTAKLYPGNPRAGLPVVKDVGGVDRKKIQYFYDVDPATGYKWYGKKVRMVDYTGGETYTYDKRGRLIETAKTVLKDLEGRTGSEVARTLTTYYDSDVPKDVTLPTGEVISQQLNEYGQLTRQASASTVYVNGQVTNVLGLPTSISIPSPQNPSVPVIQSRSYDSTGKLITFKVTASNTSSPLLDQTIVSRDNVGNITQFRNNVTGNSLQYAYNNAQELTSVAGAPYTASYTIDPEGNITRKTEGNTTTTMIYEVAENAARRHAPKMVNGYIYRYDANGNLLEDEKRIYLWDYDNKPVRITRKDNGDITEFAYDGNGARVFKKVLSTRPSVSPTRTPTLTPTGIPVPTSYSRAPGGLNRGMYVGYDTTNPVGNTLDFAQGSNFFLSWRQIEPANGGYNWGSVDQRLAAIPATGKGAILRIVVRCGDKTEGTTTFDECAPDWAVETDPILTTPPAGCVAANKRLHYLSPTVKNSLMRMIIAFGARYQNNPKVAGIEIALGYAGEPIPWPATTAVCDQTQQSTAYLANPAYSEGAWAQYHKDIISTYAYAFAGKKPLTTIINAGFADSQRASVVKHAVDRGVGFILTSLQADYSINRGSANNVCYWGYITDPSFTNDSPTASSAYHTPWAPFTVNTGKVPLGFEFTNRFDPTGQIPNAEQWTRWSMLNALDKKADYVLPYNPKGTVPGNADMPAVWEYFTTYTGHTAASTPDVWIAFHSPNKSSATRCADIYDYSWYLVSELEKLPYLTSTQQAFANSVDTTTGVRNMGPNTDYRSAFARKTTTSWPVINLDIDDKYLFNGTYTADIIVTYFDHATGGKWALSYDSRTGKKQAGEVSLTGTNTWKEKVYTVTDAQFANRLPKLNASSSGTGFDISLERVDAIDDYFHSVRVVGKNRVTPTPGTPTPTPTVPNITLPWGAENTPTPSSNATATPSVQPTVTPTGNPPLTTTTPTHTPVPPITRTPTPTLTGTGFSTPTPTRRPKATPTTTIIFESNTNSRIPVGARETTMLSPTPTPSSPVWSRWFAGIVQFVMTVIGR